MQISTVRGIVDYTAGEAAGSRCAAEGPRGAEKGSCRILRAFERFFQAFQKDLRRVLWGFGVRAEIETLRVSLYGLRHDCSSGFFGRGCRPLAVNPTPTTCQASMSSLSPGTPDATKWKFPKIGGGGGPYNKDPIIHGTILGSPIFGNSPKPLSLQS